ncbi:hypothetical protein HJC23_002241 [Cyclotella cryptica]|uniref:Uncharacterized protein n=1 Tax=Cyclotella cryptica TaxID=29204 RepID=A0ABD3QFF0_9STRA
MIIRDYTYSRYHVRSHLRHNYTTRDSISRKVLGQGGQSYFPMDQTTATPIPTKEIQCVDETKTFVSVVDCVFVGDVDALTIAEADLTVSGFKTVYNELQAESVCDSLQRLVLNVSTPTVVQVNDTVADPSKGEFVLRYEITGSCRGCPEPVLFDDSINRNPSTSRLSLGHNGRELATTCTCPAGGEDRGLEQDDFVNAYQNWIDEKVALDHVENLSGLVSLSESGAFTAAGIDDSSAGAASTVTSLMLVYSLIITWALRKQLFSY